MKVPWQQNISLNSYHTTEVDGHLLSKRKKNSFKIQTLALYSLSGRLQVSGHSEATVKKRGCR